MTEQHTLWVVDECPDSGGFATIRPNDGGPHGDTDVQPIATVYLDAHARLIAAAPELLAALEPLLATGNLLYGVAKVVRREYEIAADQARAVLAKAGKETL